MCIPKEEIEKEKQKEFKESLEFYYPKSKERNDMKTKLRNILTGVIIDVHRSTDAADSSYGSECWVDDTGHSYGQCQFGPPFGFELIIDDSDD